MLIMLLFAVVLTLTLQPALGQRCVDEGNKALRGKQYNTFLEHHQNNNIPESDDIGRWNTFIYNIDTWDRKYQSFFPESEHTKVEAVCSTAGKIYPNSVNLCISKKPIKFYYVTISIKKKKVKSVRLITDQYVILGCEKIENRCLPIHFEKNRYDDRPDNNQPNCS